MIFKNTLLKIKVIHDATEEALLSKWFCKEPLTFLFHKRVFVAKEGSSDYKR